MPHNISRRKALAAGIVGSGLLSKKAVAQKTSDASHPPFLSPWSPPAGLKRDLTPGKISVRLASWSNKTTLDYKRDGAISITGMVKRVRDGHGKSISNQCFLT